MSWPPMCPNDNNFRSPHLCKENNSPRRTYLDMYFSLKFGAAPARAACSLAYPRETDAWESPPALAGAGPVTGTNLATIPLLKKQKHWQIQIDDESLYTSFVFEISRK